MSLKPLPSSTVKLLGSAQVITSVSNAVKELVENSIDAGGDCIEVKLENYGLDRLEVRDNGCGISRDDVEVMCQKSYTSKISDFSDLDRLDTYGFRGEALSSLCSVGKVTITTVTAGDDVAKCYTMDASGKIVNSSLSHITKGTIVVVENLFRNLPVRRQLMSTKKRKTEELKRIEGVVKCLAIVQPRIRLTLAHNKFCIWQKNKVHNLRQSLVQAIPPTMVNQLYDLEYQDEEVIVKIHMMIPRKDCNVHALCYGNLADTFYLFINRRPVRDRQLDKVIENMVLILRK
ncbi:hypothetical protein AAG570_002883 [Ranatra chinensis]|uniref:Uncharacterized protein n=1 Tax=Ranatra chinensis TaxID=642074 RepID=A0ABD0Y557_9HEMI